MRLNLGTLLCLAASFAVCSALLPAREAMPAEDVAMVLVPQGQYRPLQQKPGDPAQAVPAFLMDVRPVTNRQFLAFVAAHPKWRRSRVARIYADAHYLQHWSGDLELGPSAPPEAPVANVSWFAARAYAAAAGKRLPSLAEWERAAAVGYRVSEARDDSEMMRDLYRWLAQPTPLILPAVTQARANALGLRALFGYVWEWVDDFNAVMVTGESRADGSSDRNLFCGAGSLGTKDTSDYAAFMRLALRGSLKASDTTSSLGFRCAADAPSRKAGNYAFSP